MVHCTRWASGLVWGAYPHCLTGGGCAPLLYGYHYIRLYVIVNSKIMICVIYRDQTLRDMTGAGDIVGGSGAG